MNHGRVERPTLDSWEDSINDIETVKNKARREQTDVQDAGDGNGA